MTLSSSVSRLVRPGLSICAQGPAPLPQWAPAGPAAPGLALLDYSRIALVGDSTGAAGVGSQSASFVLRKPVLRVPVIRERLADAGSADVVIAGPFWRCGRALRQPVTAPRCGVGCGDPRGSLADPGASRGFSLLAALASGSASPHLPWNGVPAMRHALGYVRSPPRVLHEKRYRSAARGGAGYHPSPGPTCRPHRQEGAEC